MMFYLAWLEARRRSAAIDAQPKELAHRAVAFRREKMCDERQRKTKKEDFFLSLPAANRLNFIAESNKNDDLFGNTKKQQWIRTSSRRCALQRIVARDRKSNTASLSSIVVGRRRQSSKFEFLRRFLTIHAMPSNNAPTGNAPNTRTARRVID